MRRRWSGSAVALAVLLTTTVLGPVGPAGALTGALLPTREVPPSGFATMHAESGARLWGSTPDERSVVWSAGQSEITASRRADGSVEVELRSEEESATLRLAGQGGSPLTTGPRDHAISFGQDAHQTDAARLGLDVRGLGCHDSFGSFRVHELSDDLTRLWVTYEIRCVQAPGRLFGEVRLGAPAGAGPSVPASRVAWPAQHVGLAGLAVPLRVTRERPGPIEVRLSGDGAFRLVGDSCGADAAARDVCRVLVGFRPGSAGAHRGEVDLTAGGRTRTVVLTGEGRPGTTRLQVDRGHGMRTVTPGERRPTVVVDGDASQIRFSARYPRAGLPGFTDEVAGIVTAPGGGLVTGRTYRDVDGSAPRGSTEPTFSVNPDGGGSNDGDATVTVHEATYGPDGGLRSLALSYRVNTSTGALNWQAREPVRPDDPPRQPVNSGLPPPGVAVKPQIGAADVSWDRADQGATVPEAIVAARQVAPGARERTVFRGRTLRAHVDGLRTTQDVVFTVRYGARGPRSTVRVQGSRMALVPGRETGSSRPVRGRLVDSQGRGRGGETVRVHVRGPVGGPSTRSIITGPAGRFVVRGVRTGTRVTAVWSGTNGFDQPGAFGGVGVVRVR